MIPKLVETTDLPEYPIARSVRLDGNAFTKWHHLRWLNSSLHLLASYEVQGMARALFDLAQLQSPVGTLPDDPLMIARLLRVDPGQWDDMRRRAISPLHNWQPCLSDGERRLMHPVVLEQVLDAIERREQHALSKEEKAAYQRVKRLREAMEKIDLAIAKLQGRRATPAKKKSARAKPTKRAPRTPRSKSAAAESGQAV
jgi:hypothetical protein